MDYLIDENNDLIIENGGFKKGNPNNQDVQKILSSNVGDFKQYPTLGVSVIDFINSSNPYQLEQRVRLNLKSDGFSVNRVRYSNGEISIDADK